MPKESNPITFTYKELSDAIDSARERGRIPGGPEIKTLDTALGKFTYLKNTVANSDKTPEDYRQAVIKHHQEFSNKIYWDIEERLLTEGKFTPVEILMNMKIYYPGYIPSEKLKELTREYFPDV